MLEDKNKRTKPEEALDAPDIEIEDLVGFFDLLITVDRRINPERYD